MSETELPDPDTPRDDPDLEAALRDPAFDGAEGAGGAADDPSRPEDIAQEPGAPHLGLDEEQVEDAED